MISVHDGFTVCVRRPRYVAENDPNTQRKIFAQGGLHKGFKTDPSEISPSKFGACHVHHGIFTAGRSRTGSSRCRVGQTAAMMAVSSGESAFENIECHRSGRLAHGDRGET